MAIGLNINLLDNYFHVPNVYSVFDYQFLSYYFF